MKLWGGRFAKEIDRLQRLNDSLRFDIRLARKISRSRLGERARSAGILDSDDSGCCGTALSV
jgi:argininosuccinate lyase